MNRNEHLQEVEGSGAIPSLTEKQKGEAGADTEWEASGISPDDEDGDIVEGSGAHIGPFHFAVQYLFMRKK